MTVLQQDTSPGPAMSTVSSITSDRYITPEYLAHLPTSVSSHTSYQPSEAVTRLFGRGATFTKVCFTEQMNNWTVIQKSEISEKCQNCHNVSGIVSHEPTK